MPRNTGPDRKTKNLIVERSNGMCERCAVCYAVDVHHRKPRRMGGTRDTAVNCYSNLVALCRECHTWIELHREAANREGWLLHAMEDPAEVPVVMERFGPVYLTMTGTYHMKTVE